jgi:hypothetical protein
MMSEEASLKGVFAVGAGVLRRSAWCVCVWLKRWGWLEGNFVWRCGSILRGCLC